MRCDGAGRQLIERFEGCRLDAYQDVAGIWTIGYGHTGADVTEGLAWTQDQADQALAADLAATEDAVTEALAPALSAGNVTEDQFSACVCLAYNIGAQAFAGSSLCRLINAGNFSAAAAEFPKWDHAGGQVVDGLLRRRIAEQHLFLGGEA